METQSNIWWKWKEAAYTHKEDHYKMERQQEGYEIIWIERGGCHWPLAYRNYGMNKRGRHTSVWVIFSQFNRLPNIPYPFVSTILWIGYLGVDTGPNIQIPQPSYNALLPKEYFVQVVMWVISDKTYHVYTCTYSKRLGQLLITTSFTTNDPHHSLYTDIPRQKDLSDIAPLQLYHLHTKHEFEWHAKWAFTVTGRGWFSLVCPLPRLTDFQCRHLTSFQCRHLYWTFNLLCNCP